MEEKIVVKKGTVVALQRPRPSSQLWRPYHHEDWKNGVDCWAPGVAHPLRDLAMWSEATHTDNCRGNASVGTLSCLGPPCCVYHHLKTVIVPGDPTMVSRKCSLFLLMLLALFGSPETLSTQPDPVASSVTSALS